MASGERPGSVLHELGRAFTEGSVAGMGEGQLLSRFAADGDEVAFGAIVARHGPMVLGVCRRHLPDPNDVESVVDICTGSGCLAILAARIFPNAEVDAVDLSADALEVAKINVAEHDLEGRVSLHKGDLFGPLKGKTYDLIITNPPYVDHEEMAVLPEEYRTEPAMALDGGPDGLDIVRRLLSEAPKHLNPGGGMICEIGTGRELLEEEFPDLDFFWLDTEESQGEVFWITADGLGVGEKKKSKRK